MMRILALLCLLMGLAPCAALAQAAGNIIVMPVSGAPKPFDDTIAQNVAEQLVRIGYQATTDKSEAGVVSLSGKASARSTSNGAIFRIVWTFTDGNAATLSSFTTETTAPYDAKDPWDAFDADTLTVFAKKIALDAEKALKQPASKKPAVPLAAKNGGTGDAVLLGGNARIFIKGVSGAPSDGNLALANALAQFFAQFDVELLPAAASDAYVIEAQVKVTPTQTGQERVEILWLLETLAGKEIARIAQDNKVPGGSLSPHWGSVAIYAAEGAADGLLSVISQLGPVPPAR